MEESVKTSKIHPNSLANIQKSQVKGVCHNPGGRPKGLAAEVREAVSQGKDLIEFHLRILHDEGQKTADRISAAEWLTNRGFGKAVEMVMNLSETEDSKKLAVEIAKEILASKNAS